MTTGFWGAFLGSLGGSAILLVILHFLSSKFIEHQLDKALAKHKHGLNKQLAAVVTGMIRLGDVLSRRNKREFKVAEEAWDLLIKAVGVAQGRFFPGRPMPSFVTMDGVEADRLIDTLLFKDEQKERLHRSRPERRDALYETFDLERSHSLCYDAWVELKNFVNTHEIFFQQEIYEAFIKIRDDLNGVIVHVEMFIGNEPMPFSGSEHMKVNHDLQEIDKKVSALAKTIRERFGFSEK